MRPLWQRYLDTFRGLPRNAWVLAVVVLINRSGSMVLVFMTLYLTLELGVSPVDAAWTISLYGIGGMGGTLLGGWLTDRLGANRVQVISLLLNGFCFILLGHLSTLHAIRLVMLLTGLVSEGFRPANAAAVGDACPPHLMTRGFALNRLAINVGSTIGPALGGLLVLVSYRFLFWVDGLTCLSAALLLAFLTRSQRHHTPAPHHEMEQIPRRHPIADIPFLAFWLVMLVYGMLFMQLLSTYPLYMNRELGYPESVIGLVFALNAILVTLIEMPLTTKFSHRSPLTVALWGIFLFGIGFTLMPLNTSGWFITLTVIIWSMGEILSFPQFSAMVALRAGPRSRGRYMGMYTLSFSTALVLGPALGGIVYEMAGPNILFTAFLPISLLMMGLLASVGRPMFPKPSQEHRNTIGS